MKNWPVANGGHHTRTVINVRAGAGINDHLIKWKFWQTDMYVINARTVQVSWLNNVFWLYCISSYLLKAHLRYLKIAIQRFEYRPSVCITDHNDLILNTYIFWKINCFVTFILCFSQQTISKTKYII